MKRAPARQIPEPNPAWTYSPPEESDDRSVVWVDASLLVHVEQHYRCHGLLGAEKKRGCSP